MLNYLKNMKIWKNINGLDVMNIFIWSIKNYFFTFLDFICFDRFNWITCITYSWYFKDLDCCERFCVGFLLLCFKLFWCWNRFNIFIQIFISKKNKSIEAMVDTNLMTKLSLYSTSKQVNSYTHALNYLYLPVKFFKIEWYNKFPIKSSVQKLKSLN